MLSFFFFLLIRGLKLLRVCQDFSVNVIRQIYIPNILDLFILALYRTYLRLYLFYKINKNSIYEYVKICGTLTNLYIQSDQIIV